MNEILLIPNISLYLKYNDFYDMYKLYPNILNSINKQYIIKANKIKKFLKMSVNMFKSIDTIDLNTTKLMGLFYFKNYEHKYAIGWIDFSICEWKNKILTESKSYYDILNENISIKYKLFKIQQNLTLEDISSIGW